MLYSIPVNGNN